MGPISLRRAAGIASMVAACSGTALALPPGDGAGRQRERAAVEEQNASRGTASLEATVAPRWKRIRYGDPDALSLRSQVGLVIDEKEGTILYARDIDKPRPIASLTKILTVMVLLDARLSFDEAIEITREDRDRLKATGSLLRYGSVLSRGDLMKVAFIASDNRAAAALARTYPGGTQTMIGAMNDKTRALGLTRTHITDSSGLHPDNVSTARDLATLVHASRRYPLIGTWSRTRRFTVADRRTGATFKFRNTNSLVHRDSWRISFSKTGFTSEAGNCLAMRTTIDDRRLIVVLLNSWGKLSKYGDSGRIRRWLVANDPVAGQGQRRDGSTPVSAGARPPTAASSL